MKKNQKGFTLVELLAVIVILAVIILIAVNAVLPQMQKARKKSFADEGLSFAKAAENAYVDNQESGTKAFTVKYLKKNYVTKSDEAYKGCIIIKADPDGNIEEKKIYLAQEGKWMIVGVTTDALGNSLDSSVKTYTTDSEKDPHWSTDYAACTVTGIASTDVYDITTSGSGE